jgi:hypothetical protein
VAEPGSELLQAGLVVPDPGLFRSLCNPARPERQDHALSALQASVDVDRTDDRLDGVGEDRVLLPPPGGLLARCQQQVCAQVERTGDLGECPPRDHGRPHFRHLTLSQLRIRPVEEVRDDQLKNGVAKELESFVVVPGWVVRADRAVGQREVE